MTISLNPIGQLALAPRDVDRAEAFYGEAPGLRKLYRFGDPLFYDCAGIRLMIETARDPDRFTSGTTIYFRCADLALTRRALIDRGVVFKDEPHRIARMEDHDLWMTFFDDSDGNPLAPMQEAPRDHDPRPARARSS